MTLRYLGDSKDKGTHSGGTATEEYFKTLPGFLSTKFPMLGTRDRSGSDENSLYLPEKTLVYWLGATSWVATIKEISLWTNTEETGVINALGTVKIYTRTFTPGHYTLDSIHGYYLFTDPVETP